MLISCLGISQQLLNTEPQLLGGKGLCSNSLPRTKADSTVFPYQWAKGVSVCVCVCVSVLNKEALLLKVFRGASVPSPCLYAPMILCHHNHLAVLTNAARASPTHYSCFWCLFSFVFGDLLAFLELIYAFNHTGIWLYN